MFNETVIGPHRNMFTVQEKNLLMKLQTAWQNGEILKFIWLFKNVYQKTTNSFEYIVKYRLEMEWEQRI